MAYELGVAIEAPENPRDGEEEVVRGLGVGMIGAGDAAVIAELDAAGSPELEQEDVFNLGFDMDSPPSDVPTLAGSAMAVAIKQEPSSPRAWKRKLQEAFPASPIDLCTDSD